jgi:hypothetical protein
MCNNSNCQHDDLNDDLGDIFADMDLDPSRPRDTSSLPPIPAVPAQPLFVEPCRACRGSGRFYSYTGRLVGNCFKCKGTGKQSFKTAPDTRAKNRESAQNAKDRKASAGVAEFSEKHTEEFAWIIVKAGTFNFATEMLNALNKFGHLTERQLATVTRLMLQDKERDAARTAAKAEAEAKAVAVDITPIMKAMETAMANDIKRPLLRAGDFKFAYKPGVIYVRNRSGDIYYGKIVEGRFFQSRDCTAEDQAKIVEVASDPMQAAIAYGRREGACAICGRTLTNHESIDRGIGPICAENFGW